MRTTAPLPLLLVVTAGLAAWAVAASTPPDRRPTAAAPVKLLLQNPTGRTAPNTQCDMEFCTSLLDLIQNATTSIDFAIYGVRGQAAVVDALEAAQARGVTVRGVVDRTVDGKNYYSDTDDMVRRLGTVRDDLAVDKRSALTKKPYDPATSMCWMTPAPGFLGPKQCVGYDLGDTCVIAVHASHEALTFQGDIMHDKFFVVDGTYVWMGSTNVSDSCSGGYNSNLVGVIHSPIVAGWYAAEFEQMWEGHHHKEKVTHRPMVTQLTPEIRVEAFFSPQDDPMDDAVRPALQKAKERIDVAIFFLTHKGIASDLIAAHRRGVKVRVILDATAAGNGYTKHELLRVAGVPVKIEAWGGKMHMKAAAIDGETVIMGSMNWTSAGEGGNDENTIVLHSRAHAAQFHAFYDKLWADVPERWLQGRPDPESQDSAFSCTDGVDNDYDHMADAADPGCGPNPPPLAELPPYWVYPKTEGSPLLKGNIGEDGRRTYYAPGSAMYEEVQINPSLGEAYFCSEEDAKRAGYRRAAQ